MTMNMPSMLSGFLLLSGVSILACCSTSDTQWTVTLTEIETGRPLGNAEVKLNEYLNPLGFSSSGRTNHEGIAHVDVSSQVNVYVINIDAGGFRSTLVLPRQAIDAIRNGSAYEETGMSGAGESNLRVQIRTSEPTL